MAYELIGFVNDTVPDINAENLNHMDNGISDNDKRITALNDNVNGLSEMVVDVADAVSDDIDLGITPASGFYSANGGGYASSSLYKYIMTPCNPGDCFIVNSTYGGNAHVALFYNGSPAASTFVGLYGGEKTTVESYAVDMPIVIPDGVSYVVFDSKVNVTFNVKKRTYYTVAKKTELDAVDNELDSLENVLKQYITPEVTFVTGKLYNINNKTVDTYANGAYFNYTLPNQGLFTDVRISGHSLGSHKYDIISFWDSNGDKISSYGNTSTDYTNQLVSIPANTYSVVMNVNTNYSYAFDLYGIVPGGSPEVAESGDIYYQLEDDILYVSTRFNSTNDFVVKFRKKGGNNLPDFGYFYTNSNSELKPKPNMTSISELFSQGSDWHGPMIVRAVNNIDGDNVNSHHWTGGNHQYNNTGTGSTPTARCIDLKFYVDNAIITSGNGYCNSIRITWTNMIQAYNTKKSDGSGREVLQENHTLYFNGKNWESTTELIALEDVVFERFYGFQYGGTGTWLPKIRYVGATNRLEYIGHDGSNCGDKTSAIMKAYGDTYELDLTLDTQYDLGKREHYTGIKGLFTSTYGKGYTYVIGDDDDPDGLTNYPVYEDEMIALHGFYEFRPAEYQ